jgi:hypothetical protein
MSGTSETFLKFSKRMSRYGILAALLLLAGCQRPAPAPQISPVEAVLSNGTWGARLGAVGLGKELPAFDIDRYDKSAEEKILAQPNPLNLQLTSPDGEVTIMRSEWLPNAAPYTVQATGDLKVAGNQTVFNCQVMIHPTERLISYTLVWDNSEVKLSLAGSSDYESKVVASDRAIGVTIGPKGKPFPEHAELGELIFSKTRELPTIEIESSDPEDAEYVKNALWRLQTELPRSGKPFAPMGVSSDIYFGHTFWDADIWMMPVFVLFAPDRARALAQYRLDRVPQARANYVNWVGKGRPTALGRVERQPIPSPEAIMFPWESSQTGKETVPGPSQWQHHITGSVAFGLDQAASYGLADPAKVRRTVRGAGAFYMDRMEEVRGTAVGVFGTMSPDENRIGDNDLYTNLIGDWARRAGYPGQNFATQIYRPKDATSLLTYDDDPVKGYKQAAAVLAIYPLRDPVAVKQAKVMIDRFQEKVTKNGPAMSDAIHALIHANLGDTDRAYQEWRKAWKDFVRGPQFMFSEKRKSDRTYFYTGAAGTLQTVIYGFAGFPTRGNSFKNLQPGIVKGIKPNLPKEWSKITFRKVPLHGKKFDFEITSGGVTATFSK